MPLPLIFQSKELYSLPGVPHVPDSGKNKPESKIPRRTQKNGSLYEAIQIKVTIIFQKYAFFLFDSIFASIFFILFYKVVLKI